MLVWRVISARREVVGRERQLILDTDAGEVLFLASYPERSGDAAHFWRMPDKAMFDAILSVDTLEADQTVRVTFKRHLGWDSIALKFGDLGELRTSAGFMKANL